MRSVRLILLFAGVLVALGAVFGGAFSTGAIFFLLPWPPNEAPRPQRDPSPPFHKGHVDLSTGLYVRVDEDLVVAGVPEVVLRRAYLSNYHVSRQFGVGATHDGEVYLIGDGQRFQWASLILATGTRINFRRVSPGTTFWNALYEHRESTTEWQGARLGWTGINWALRRADGGSLIFKGCDATDTCSILHSRDADGTSLEYRRDVQGRLKSIEGSRAWIGFEYDDKNRIVRATDSEGDGVQYGYDAGGRLTSVRGKGGVIRRYTYTTRDEMATILEPGTDIENIYDSNGRCTRQINRFPDQPGSQPYVFDFSYRLEGQTVVETDSSESDGTRQNYRFKNGYPIAETWGRIGSAPAAFTYERDSVTSAITALTVTCPDRTGRPLRHSGVVNDGNEEWVKRDLLESHCSWRRAAAPEQDAAASIR